MRVAPPVQALSCGAGPWNSVQSALTALSAAVGAWWLGAWLREPDPLLAAGSVAFGAAAAWAARRVLEAAPRQLAWDGGAWHVADPGGGRLSGRAELMLDLGHWMLVRFSADGSTGAAWRGRLWLPLRRRDAAAAWPALRVALYAAQPSASAA